MSIERGHTLHSSLSLELTREIQIEEELVVYSCPWVFSRLQTACIYYVAQILGAFMGYGTIIVLTPAAIIEQSGPSFSTTVPHPDVSAGAACCIESIATAILVWVCCAVWDPRNVHAQDSVPIRFGLAITCLVAVAVRLQNAST